jgi:hypothetical protein
MKMGSDNFQPNMAQTLFSLQKNKEAQASALSTQSNSVQVSLSTSTIDANLISPSIFI